MQIRFQKPADSFLEELLTDTIAHFKKNYGDPNKVDPKFFGVCAAQAVKSKFIVTIKESNRLEMMKVLRSRNRIDDEMMGD